MKRIPLFRKIICLALLIGMPAAARAGEPLDQLRGTTEKVLSLLAIPALKAPGKVRERRELILKTVDERFDWEEMARRSLGRHWAQRTPEEKKAFTLLYRELLERAYVDKVEGYSWNKIHYDEERIDGNYAAIKVRIFTAKDQVIQVEYRLWKKGDQWMVYDFSVEGVSLVNNYRTQFNEIMVKSSFQELIKRLRAKSVQN